MESGLEPLVHNGKAKCDLWQSTRVNSGKARYQKTGLTNLSPCNTPTVWQPWGSMATRLPPVYAQRWVWLNGSCDGNPSNYDGGVACAGCLASDSCPYFSAADTLHLSVVEQDFLRCGLRVNSCWSVTLVTNGSTAPPGAARLRGRPLWMVL